MLTSARNQLSGKITAIERGAVNDEVTIGLPDGQTVTAIVTHSSTESLGLEVGGEAFALVKASWIILLTDTAGVKLSTRNQLAGTVSEVSIGAVNAEVTLMQQRGIVPEDWGGETITVKASHVVIGVKQ